MRNKILIGALLSAAALTTVSAHVMVSPLQSKPGASQKYEVRVHNEAKVAATTIDLTIPDPDMVLDDASGDWNDDIEAAFKKGIEDFKKTGTW